MVLVEAGGANPSRKSPEKGLVRSSDLATGKAIPAVKTSDPLSEARFRRGFVTMIKGQVPQLSAHANDPPRDKLPADAQRIAYFAAAKMSSDAPDFRVWLGRTIPEYEEWLARIKSKR